MKTKIVFYYTLKTLLVFACVICSGFYTQPGPGSFSMFVYNKERKELKLNKDYEMYALCKYNGFKMTAGKMSYEKTSCNPRTSVPYVPVVTEASENIITLVCKKDTMNIVVRNVISIGYKHCIDTVVFKKGWYEFKYPKFDKPPYDTCFFNLVRLGKATIVAIKPR